MSILNSTSPAAAGLDDVTQAQRLSAVGAAMVGVFGATTAFVAIRWIGKRAHPLLSVNYFAAWTGFVSGMALVVIPGITFRLPSNLRDWGFLLVIVASGMLNQLLLTAGLQHEKSSRATNMLYTSVVFAVIFDKIVWNNTPNVLSVVGSGVILACAIYVAVQKCHSNPAKNPNGEDSEYEGQGLVTGDEWDEENLSEIGGGEPVQLRTI